MDLREFAAHLERTTRLRPRTIYEYCKVLQRGIAAGDPLAEAKRTDVSNGYREIARAAALHLVAWARPEALPAVRRQLNAIGRPVRHNKPPPPPLTDAEWERLKAHVHRLPDPRRAVLQLLMISGMRIGDALGVRRSAVLAAQRGEPFLVLVKGGKQIVLPFGAMRAPLERLLRADAWEEVWELLGTSKPLAEEAVRRVLRYAAKRCQITRRLHPHLLRHTVAYRLIERTRDLHLVSKLLGHSSTETTELYTWYRSQASMNEALEQQSQ